MALTWGVDMPSIQIKNVPPDVHRVLRRRAAEAGMSLQEYLLAELTAQARQPTLEEILEDAGRETGGTNLSTEEWVRLIREDRESH
jgi:plasmid stability protein